MRCAEASTLPALHQSKFNEGVTKIRIVLATHHLLSWTGSEVTVATLARLLHVAGHQVLVYAPLWSSASFTAELLGDIPAVSKLTDVEAFAPDAVYSQHHPVVTGIRAALPGTPIAHAVLGVLPHLEQPPRRKLGIGMFLAISEEVSAALQGASIGPQRVRLFRNLVDDETFNAVPADRSLSRVVCFSYKLGAEDMASLAAETERRGLALVAPQPVRAGSIPHSRVPSIVEQGEVVVASGRGAIEAMLCGRVPLILADCGDDGLVTPDNFDALMRVNFSGRGRGQKLDAQAVGAELDNYRPEYGAELQRLARQHLGTSARREETLSLFDELASSRVAKLSASALDDLDFERKNFELQRDIAIRASAFRSAHLGDPVAPGDVPALLLRGDQAWGEGDTDLAFDTYLLAFHANTQTAHAARRLGRNLLVQLVTREMRAGNPAGQRTALRAFLALSPDNEWANKQLANLDAMVAPDASA